MPAPVEIVQEDDALTEHSFQEAVIGKVNTAFNDPDAPKVTEIDDISSATEDQRLLEDLGEVDPQAVEETPEVEEREPQGGVAFDAAGRARDPDTGHYLSAEEAARRLATEEPEAEAEEDDEYIELEFSDPALAEYLSKYDGDIEKALKSAMNAESLIGRQSQEVAETRALRSELDQLKGMLAAGLAQQQAPPPLAPITNEMIEYEPARAAKLAADRGDVETLTRAVDSWISSGDPKDAFQAALFVAQIDNDMRESAIRAELEQMRSAPAPEPAAPPALAGVVQRYPDMNDRLPAMREILVARQDLAGILESESSSPEAKAAVVETLYLAAGGRQEAGSLQRDLVRKARVKTREDAQAERSKRVVSGASKGRGSAGTAEGQGQRVPLFLQHFRAHMGLEIE